MNFKETIKNIRNYFPDVVATGLITVICCIASISSTLLPGLFQEDEGQIALYIFVGTVIFVIVGLGLTFIIVLIQVPPSNKNRNNSNHKNYTTQWLLYVQLAECQKKHQRTYLFMVLIVIIYLVMLTILAIFQREETIKYIIEKCKWELSVFLFLYFMLIIFLIVRLYLFRINYQSNDSLLLLWDRIKNLEKSLGIKSPEELKNILNNKGKEDFEKMIYEFGVGCQSNDFFSKDGIHKILEEELIIIEQLEKKFKEKNDTCTILGRLQNKIKLFLSDLV